MKKRNNKKDSAWFKDKVIRRKDKYSLKKILNFLLLIPLRISVSPKWWRLHKEKTKELLERSSQKLASKEYTFIPAGLALYMFMGFVPVMIITFSILSAVDFRIKGLDDNFQKFVLEGVLNRYIPGIKSSLPQTISLFSENAWTSTAFIILIISSLWLASSGYGKFVASQSILFEHENLGNPFMNRIKGIAIVLSISIFLSLTLIIVGPILMVIKRALLNDPILYELIFYISSLFTLFFFFYIGWLLFYKFTPVFRLTFRQVHPGALITAIPSSAFTVVLGSLISFSLLSYEKYGTWATFIYISTFLFFIAYFIYFGITINQSFYKTFFSTSIVDKKNWRIMKKYNRK